MLAALMYSSGSQNTAKANTNNDSRESFFIGMEKKYIKYLIILRFDLFLQIFLTEGRCLN